MKIERYEPYHIGIKFESGQDMGVLIGRIRKALSTRSDYKVTGEPQIAPAIEKASGKVVLAVKDDVKIELNFPAAALNTIGENPKKVSDTFKEVASEILPSEGYDMDIVVSFYEILTHVTIKSDKEPTAILNNSMKLDLELFKQRNVSISGLKMSNEFMLRDRGRLTEVIVEPNATSPRDKFKVSLIYRSIDKVEIAQFHEKVEDFVIKLIQSLEA